MSGRKVHVIVQIAITADDVVGLAAVHAHLQREAGAMMRARPDIEIQVSEFDRDFVIGSIKD